jgi:DNA-directed RNA polymerases I, II, and III subunit RPABC2
LAEAENEDPNAIMTEGEYKRSNIVETGSKGVKGQKAPVNKKVPDNERTTTPFMTKYERARVLGTRALQIR